MALNPLMFSRLVGMLKEGQAIASMGYPDILIEPQAFRELMGEKILGVKYRPESKEICGRHKIPYRDIPDAESVFEQFGVSLDVYDIVKERGCETVCDLNFPIPEAAVAQYDYVLDVGTLEHCFNIGQALFNMASMAKVGGYVFHENPFNWGNHGFYNLNPTLFHDFYGDNGFEVVDCVLMDFGTKEMYQAPAKARFKWKHGEANILTIARRVELKEFSMPMQGKYRGKNEDSRKDRDGSADAGS